VVAIKAPGFGERKTQYLEDIAILTGGTVVRDEIGITLDKADESCLGVAARIEVGKEYCTIVGDGSQVRKQERVGFCTLYTLCSATLLYYP
jgi:chaperonin GroEL